MPESWAYSRAFLILRCCWAWQLHLFKLFIVDVPQASVTFEIIPEGRLFLRVTVLLGKRFTNFWRCDSTKTEAKSKAWTGAVCCKSQGEMSVEFAHFVAMIGSCASPCSRQKAVLAFLFATKSSSVFVNPQVEECELRKQSKSISTVIKQGNYMQHVKNTS